MGLHRVGHDWSALAAAAAYSLTKLDQLIIALKLVIIWHYIRIIILSKKMTICFIFEWLHHILWCGYILIDITISSCEELTHWKRLWCWEGLGAGGEGDDRGWDGWMASPTQWTWVCVNSGSWWWTGRPGMLQFMESQRVGHDWATELNWFPCGLLTI